MIEHAPSTIVVLDAVKLMETGTGVNVREGVMRGVAVTRRVAVGLGRRVGVARFVGVGAKVGVCAEPGVGAITMGVSVGTPGTGVTVGKTVGMASLVRVGVLEGPGMTTITPSSVGVGVGETTTTATGVAVCGRAVVTNARKLKYPAKVPTHSNMPTSIPPNITAIDQSGPDAA